MPSTGLGLHRGRPSTFVKRVAMLSFQLPDRTSLLPVQAEARLEARLSNLIKTVAASW